MRSSVLTAQDDHFVPWMEGAVKILQAVRPLPQHGHTSPAARGKLKAVCEGSQLRKKRKETRPRDTGVGHGAKPGRSLIPDPGAIAQRGHKFGSGAFCLGNMMGGTGHTVYTLRHQSVEAMNNFRDCTGFSHESPKRG